MDRRNVVVPGDESVEELDDWVTWLGECTTQANDNVEGTQIWLAYEVLLGVLGSSSKLEQSC